MKINTNYSNFKKKHKNKKNQIIFHAVNCKSNKTIENVINNFLIKKNSFIFESVEKRKIRGRYTIIGADPDKIWEFNKKKIKLIAGKKKTIIKYDNSINNLALSLIKLYRYAVTLNSLRY